MTLFLRIESYRKGSRLPSTLGNELNIIMALGSVQGIGKKMLIFSAKRFESLDGLFSFLLFFFLFLHGSKQRCR